MISVLLFSRKPGRTSWAAVRGSEVVRARGLQAGDLVRVDFRGNGHEGTAYMFREEDGEASLPTGVEYVRVEHLKCSEDSRVCVDLE